MLNKLRQWLSNETVFVIANTVFWVGLMALVLTDPLRMMVGAALLSLVGACSLLYSALSPNVTRGMGQPSLARWMFATFGVGLMVFSVVIWVWIFRGGVPTRRQAQQQDIQGELIEVIEYRRTWLDLYDLNLREVPPEVWDLEQLTELNLSRNRLTSLPPEVGNLKNLEELSLWHNRLEAIPPEIGELSNLKWLDLSTNRLETLPPELARLQQLTHLKLQYNRFDTFPDVILELPNLELLFLTGNRMGELPPEIIERAEAGTLNLSYRPNASRYNWASVFVVGLTFVLPIVLSWAVDRLWTAREWAAQQAAQREGTVFPIRPLLRGHTLFVVFALFAVSSLMLIAALNGERTGVSMQTGGGLFLLFSPLILGGLFFALRHTGMVVLTAEGVVLRRPGRERFLRYDDIVTLRLRVNPLAPGLVLRGRERVLRLPRMVKNWSKLYEVLLARVPSEVRDRELGKIVATTPDAPEAAAEATSEDGPVYTFTVRGRMWALYIAGTVLLILVYLGIGLLGLWSGLAQGKIPPFTGKWMQSTLIFFFMISIIFIPALIFVIRGFFTKYGPFMIEQPVALELYRDKIRYRFPRSPWHERPVSDLQALTLRPIPFTVRGGRGIRQEFVRYMIVLDFVDDAQLAIDHERAVQFGETSERLHAMLKDLYDELPGDA